MATVCQASYPLPSENASPFGTRTLYLAGPVSWSARAMLPETASDTAIIATAGIVLLFILSLPREVSMPDACPRLERFDGWTVRNRGWKGPRPMVVTDS